MTNDLMPPFAPSNSKLERILTMKLLHAPQTYGACLAVAFALVATCPTRSAAQVITPADLLGSWARQNAKDLGYVFRADSTVLYIGITPDGDKGSMSGRWHLAGDTLVVTQVRGKVDGQVRPAQLVPRRVLLKDKQLITIRLRHVRNQPDTIVHTRVDSLPMP